jgi:hypothetical protein
MAETAPDLRVFLQIYCAVRSENAIFVLMIKIGHLGLATQTNASMFWPIFCPKLAVAITHSCSDMRFTLICKKPLSNSLTAF